MSFPSMPASLHTKSMNPWVGAAVRPCSTTHQDERTVSGRPRLCACARMPVYLSALHCTAFAMRCGAMRCDAVVCDTSGGVAALPSKEEDMDEDVTGPTAPRPIGIGKCRRGIGTLARAYMPTVLFSSSTRWKKLPGGEGRFSRVPGRAACGLWLAASHKRTISTWSCTLTGGGRRAWTRASRGQRAASSGKIPSCCQYSTRSRRLARKPRSSLDP